jgi:putative flippase GtrA
VGGLVGGLVRIGSSLNSRFAHLAHEVAKFGAVGAVAFVIDAGGFNLLVSHGLGHKVLTAKAISMTVAATFAYFANRHWTWRDRTRSGLGREYGLFFVFNLVGFGIAEACLAFSHYGLEMHSRLADNVSANIIGTALGTLFRFWAYRRWVFMDTSDVERTEEAASAAIV